MSAYLATSMGSSCIQKTILPSLVGIQLLGAISLLLWAMITSYFYFKSLDLLGKLRVSKFYEIMGIDVVMHTMSDQIGDGGDFDRNSRDHSYQDNLNNHLRM